MSHYFDDVLHRNTKEGARRHFRRSSTARSIGARSDFDTSLNGDDDARSTHTGYIFPAEDPERLKQKEEADSHMHRYISDQLNRYQGQDGNNGYDRDAEEYETKA